MPDADKWEPDRLRSGAEADLTAAVHSAQRGDAEAFAVVYRVVHPGLLRYLRVLVGRDAEDVASETWLQIVRDLGSFRGDADGFRGWAATIGRRRAVDHLRRIRRRPATDPDDGLSALPSAQDVAAGALESISTEAALNLIRTLPADQAEAVLLRAVMGLDAKTAAGVLGKRPGAVRTAAHRGLRRLAAALSAPAEDSVDPVPDRAPAPSDRADGERTRSRGRTLPATGVTPKTSPTLRRLG